MWKERWIQKNKYTMGNFLLWYWQLNSKFGWKFVFWITLAFWLFTCPRNLGKCLCSNALLSTVWGPILGHFQALFNVLRFSQTFPAKFTSIQLLHILSIIKHFRVVFAILRPISVALSRAPVLGELWPNNGLGSWRVAISKGMRLLFAHDWLANRALLKWHGNPSGPLIRALPSHCWKTEQNHRKIRKFAVLTQTVVYFNVKYVLAENTKKFGANSVIT